MCFSQSQFSFPESIKDCAADGWVISSESGGFLSIGARYVREVEPGEIVEITRTGIRSVDIVERPDERKQAFCIFEYVYFARPDSIFEGQMVYNVRLQCGRQLAREALVDADIVASVPESGTAAAHGYASESGLEFTEVLCKNRYVGRTFIQPSARLRKLGVAKKFGALSENVAGKRLILIDDSIVRGNTIGPIIKLLRGAGATEVHIRIASPPLLHPCYMGINIPTREELIAIDMTPEQLAKHVGEYNTEPYFSLFAFYFLKKQILEIVLNSCLYFRCRQFGLFECGRANPCGSTQNEGHPTRPDWSLHGMSHRRLSWRAARRVDLVVSLFRKCNIEDFIIIICVSSYILLNTCNKNKNLKLILLPIKICKIKMHLVFISSVTDV